MGRPRKETIFNLPPKESSLLVDAVNGGAVDRKDMPAMLAQAKANGDMDLVEAILKACSVG